MTNGKISAPESLQRQLDALLDQDPLVLLSAVRRRMLDESPVTDAERIEQHLCSLFLYLYRLKCDPSLEDEWRLWLEQQYTDEVAMLSQLLRRREQREHLAGLELEAC